jgi:uncharacterized protein YdeI (YjbR/CyaY-like superfamily)
MAVADEDVDGREVAMEQLTAMQAPEHLQDAGDFAPRHPLVKSTFRALEKRAEIAVTRVLEREHVQHAACGSGTGNVSKTRIARG